MFSIFGFEECVRNVYRVAHPFVGSRSISTTEDLRAPYLDFLQNHQPYMPVNRSDDVIVTDPDIENALVASYSHNTLLNDLNQSEIIGEPYESTLKSEKVAIVRDALWEFRDLDNTLGALFDSTIHSIVIRPSNRPQGRASHGGSSSAAMGTIWMAVGPTVSKADLVEMLLHELTHHLLFIDERNYPHFDYALIARDENRAFSAILNLNRPVDKVLHSIVVATELILGRQRFLPNAERVVVHPSTSKLIANAMTAHASITSLESAGQLLRPRAHEILDRCLAACTPALPQSVDV
jgi:hypothetical protein